MPVLLQKVQGRQRGFVEVCDPNGIRVEYETFTCAHDGNIVKVPHRAAPDAVGGLCRLCMQMVCPACVAAGKCDPFEKKLERMEDRGRFLREVGR